ncbi:hypothetical protein BV378_15390 [Nostoc sp. RF31YmG]|nr:hypothetical protein BV378_15390 [Nostoc sp. RF31YmG]
MRFKLQFFSIVSIISIVGFANSVDAQIKQSVEENIQVYEYPVIEPDVNLLCYVTTKTPTNFDLSRLCGFVSAPSTSGGNSRNYSSGSNSVKSNFGGDSYPSYPTGVTPSKVCNVPSDIASDGSRCGGRAASEKQGGR